jgi:hypothetical protein
MTGKRLEVKQPCKNLQFLKMIFCTYYDERHLMNTQNPHTIINAKKTLKVVAVS